MPEGDTIYRAARTLDRALAGRRVATFESVFPALTRVDEDRKIVGRSVSRVRSMGKHLLIELSGDLVLRTHMRMNGEWHVYRAGERWRRARSSMRIAIGTDEWVAVGFDIPVAEFIEARDLRRHRELAALGPDLLAEDFDQAAAVRRLLASPAATVAGALLDQRVVAGIGNVFKSEILFVSGIDPFRPVAALTPAEAERLVATARRLLRSNVLEHGGRLPLARRGYRQTTRFADPAARLWVYDRAGRPCRTCGTIIRYRKEGELVRGTYWCPNCQT